MTVEIVICFLKIHFIVYIKGGYNRIDNKPLQGRTSVAMDNQLALGARQDIDDDDEAAGASAAAAATAAVIIVPSLSLLFALLSSLSTLPILPFIPRPNSKTHEKIHQSNSQSVISSLCVHFYNNPNVFRPFYCNELQRNCGSKQHNLENGVLLINCLPHELSLEN